LELGEVVGFSITVPNWAKAVGVSSSMGIRIDGHGIEVGMLAAFTAAAMHMRGSRVYECTCRTRGWLELAGGAL
jgi:hypothetical protein